MTRPQPRSGRQLDETRVGWKMAGLAFQVSTEVAAGALLGWLFDRWQGTGPKGLLIGALAGIAVGLLTLIRGALKLNRQLDAAHPISTGGAKPIPFEDDDEDRDNAWPGEPRSND